MPNTLQQQIEWCEERVNAPLYRQDAKEMASAIMSSLRRLSAIDSAEMPERVSYLICGSSCGMPEAVRREDYDKLLTAYKAQSARADEFFNLTDRAYKMLWLAIPENREPISEASHNPITAWVADAKRSLDAAIAAGRGKV